MRRIFSDTLYWLAIFVPGDEWAEAARAADVADATLVTTEEVLNEFLTAVSAHGDHARRLACRLVREILNDPGIEVVAQSHESFVAGLALYEAPRQAIQPRGLHFDERHAAAGNRRDPDA